MSVKEGLNVTSDLIHGKDEISPLDASSRGMLNPNTPCLYEKDFRLGFRKLSDGTFMCTVTRLVDNKAKVVRVASLKDFKNEILNKMTGLGFQGSKLFRSENQIPWS